MSNHTVELSTFIYQDSRVTKNSRSKHTRSNVVWNPRKAVLSCASKEVKAKPKELTRDQSC